MDFLTGKIRILYSKEKEELYMENKKPAVKPVQQPIQKPVAKPEVKPAQKPVQKPFGKK